MKICSGLDFDTIYELAAGWGQTQGTGSSPEKNADLNFWTREKKQKIGDVFAIQACTRRSGIKLFSSFKLDSTQAIQPKIVEREKFIGAEFILKLTQNQAASFDKIAVNYWEQTIDTEQVWASGLNLAQKYSQATYVQEFVKHNDCWAEFWQRMDVEIQGDPELQQGVRYTEQGIHSSSAAGVWASMVSGFGGLRTDGGLLILNPTIPVKWNSYSFKLNYGGALIKAEVNKEYATFTIENGPDVKVQIYGQESLINSKGIKIKLTR